MQLETEQRRLLNMAVARARAYERQHFAAEIKALRAMRDEMRAKAENLEKQMAALHRALTAAREESVLLRQWWDARCAHERAKRDLAATYRQQQLERAWATEFDPINSTKH